MGLVGAISMSIWLGNGQESEKPWGSETTWAAPWGVQGKILKIKEGERTSLKYYRRKNEALYCLAGKAIVTAPQEFEFGDEKTKNGAVFYLEPGKILFIESEDPYRIRAYSDCVLIEVTHGGCNSGKDAVMIEDDYGRVKDTGKSKKDIISQ